MEASGGKKVEQISCRACLGHMDDDICIKHDIFNTTGLAKNFVLCTSLTVEAQDGFPKHLCDSCFKKVNDFRKFQVMSVDSVHRFRELLKLEHSLSIEYCENSLIEFDAKLETTFVEPDELFKEGGCNDFQGSNVTMLVLPPRQTIQKCGSVRKSSTNEDMINPLKNAKENSKTLKDALNSDDETKDSDAKHDTWQTDDDSKSVEDSQSKKSVRKKGRPSNRILTTRQKSKSYKCDICSKRFMAEHRLIAHKETHEKILNQERSMDSKRTIAQNKSETITFERLENAEKCSESDEEDKTVLQRDSLNSEPKLRLTCDICQKRFNVKHRLTAHKRTHEGLIAYPCTKEGCTKGFNRKHVLIEHLKDHEGINSVFHCGEDGCDRVYKNKHTLIMHLRKTHKKGPELKTHICEICGKIYKSSATLRDHRYTHKDKSEFPFGCTKENCDRRFTSKDKLKVHLMRHAGVKNFVCPYCGMRKTTRNELTIHINYHTLERTWPCRFCPHVCNNAFNLRRHVRIVHERARDFACRYCEKCFAKPDTRKYHEMTHTGEKPNECKECGKRFTQPTALRTHEKIHLRNRKTSNPQITAAVSLV